MWPERKIKHGGVIRQTEREEDKTAEETPPRIASDLTLRWSFFLRKYRSIQGQWTDLKVEGHIINLIFSQVGPMTRF